MATKSSSRLDDYLASDIVKKVKKKHGANLVRKATDARIAKDYRIPVGPFMMDYCMGGGLAGGGSNIIWGHKSTGKTVICTKAVGNFQKMCASCFSFPNDAGKCECKKPPREPIIAYMNAEGSWDSAWAAMHGLNEAKLIMSKPEFAEQALDITEAHLRSGEVDLVVIDSIAFLTPAKEIEESTGKALQAEQARVVGRAIRKFNAAINYCGNRWGRRPTLIYTNQLRHKLGVMFGSPDTQPGGFAPGFAASMEVRTSGGKYLMDEVTGQPIHVDMKFKIEKNKVSNAKMEGVWRLMLTDTETRVKGEVADEEDLIETGARVGLITGSGSAWECLGEKYRGKSKVTERLMKEREFKLQYQEALLRVLTA